ncbi:unnamed protein product [Rotaria sp. Silwood2]|nr:unnamed protein product [Rotaria sp. Silwood2]CAF2903037.1 unnamed protein product [Rotaria sp. Silwood2]CAF3126239.1 unnamed protein product [Rotaria sp. Silwood2]CAF3267998.1 unnamed protein product [Rotaria sp. Silwood2]CAF4247999.1 unnamed protein product [Rotaria sp. Silwood2]
MILLFWLSGFSSLPAIGWCEYVTCRHENFSLVPQTWCCQSHEICGEVAGQCKVTPVIRWFTYLITILSITIIGFCFGRRLLLCLGYRNKNWSNNISQSTHQSIPTNNIRTDEESPPSYEQVMKNDNLL